MKKKLFSIGELSKLTGAGIKSLRYYEKIGVFKPAFIDSSSGYRYYSFNQIYLLGIIMLCIELDIPLKNLTKYISKDETINYSAFLTHGKEIAKSKLKNIQRGLEFIEKAEAEIALLDKPRKDGKIYSRQISKKTLCVIPYPRPFDEDIDFPKIYEDFKKIGYTNDDYYEYLEYGYMCEYTPLGVKRYVFMEVPNRKIGGSIKVIPSGKYFCKQSEAGQIEQVSQTFKRQLKGNKSFIAIETEIFSAKSKINKPVHELRVICC